MTKVKDTSFNALNRLNVTRRAPPPKNAALAKKLEAKVADQFSRGVQAQKVATYNARGLVVQKPVLTIRGGAWSKERITPELEKGTHIMLERAMQGDEERIAAKLTPNLDPAVFEAIRNGVAVAEYLVKPQRNSGAKDFKLSQFVHQTAAAVEKTLASSPRYKGLDPSGLKDEFVDGVRKQVYNVLEKEAMAVKSGAKPTMTETTREILKKSVESPDAMREMLANPDNWVFGEGYAATTILQATAKQLLDAAKSTDPMAAVVGLPTEPTLQGASNALATLKQVVDADIATFGQADAFKKHAIDQQAYDQMAKVSPNYITEQAKYAPDSLFSQKAQLIQDSLGSAGGYIHDVLNKTYNALQNGAKTGLSAEQDSALQSLFDQGYGPVKYYAHQIINATDMAATPLGEFAQRALGSWAASLSGAQSVTTSVYDTTQKISTLDGNTGAIRGYSLKQKEGSFILAVG